jgi:hypothetical protein
MYFAGDERRAKRKEISAGKASTASNDQRRKSKESQQWAMAKVSLPSSLCLLSLLCLLCLL